MYCRVNQQNQVVYLHINTWIPDYLGPNIRADQLAVSVRRDAIRFVRVLAAERGPDIFEATLEIKASEVALPVEPARVLWNKLVDLPPQAKVNDEPPSVVSTTIGGDDSIW